MISPVPRNIEPVEHAPDRLREEQAWEYQSQPHVHRRV